MNKKTKKNMMDIIENMDGLVQSLYLQWLKKEHENFNDYAKLIKEKFEAIKKQYNISNALFLKANEVEFGFTFEINEFIMYLDTTQHEYGWEKKN